MKVLIPMAGKGQRFINAGYVDPKPLISVLGPDGVYKPMIQRVIESLKCSHASFVFVVQKEHERLQELLREIVPDCHIHGLSHATEGAACTALVAADDIYTDEPLMIANADQIVEWLPVGTIVKEPLRPDGLIYTFRSDHPKWSYAAVDEWGHVWGVAEKQVISRRATCGIYWYRSGKMFVDAAGRMIAANRRFNGEFYIAPVYNEMIADGKTVIERAVQQMWGLGTPEDLDAYENSHRTGA